MQSARPDGLDRRAGPSGALESAQRVRGRGRDPGSRDSSGAKRRASHGDRKEADRPQPPVSDEGGDRRQAGHLGVGARSVRGFMRLRSRPQRPRTGSLSAAKSAGTGQKKSTKCRRGVPVAAKRSSGATRRQEGSPRGRTGAGARRPEGRSKARPRRTMAPAREGGGIAGWQRCTKLVRSDASARPRRLQRRYHPHGKPTTRCVRAKRGRAWKRDAMGRGKSEGRGSHREACVCRRVNLVLCCSGNNQAYAP